MSGLVFCLCSELKECKNDILASENDDLAFWWDAGFLFYHRLHKCPWVAAPCQTGAAAANRYMCMSMCWLCMGEERGRKRVQGRGSRNGRGGKNLFGKKKKKRESPKRQNHPTPTPLHISLDQHDTCTGAGNCWWIPNEVALAWCNTWGFVLNTLKWWHNKKVSHVIAVFPTTCYMSNQNHPVGLSSLGSVSTALAWEGQWRY